jgi:2-polyprenyl-3-methyl-5-hydroxy-6-metoxy-1,4-benzoquinol methylase
MTQYRDTLYTNYHTTQSGRAALTHAKELFFRESWRFEKEVLPLLKNQSRKSSILDLGCGSGSLIYTLNKAGFQETLGIDLSEEQVALAHSFGVTSVQKGDILKVLKDEHIPKFDVITGMDIIEHFTKDELVTLLKLIQQKLNTGGIALFRTPNLDAPVASAYAQGDFTHENYMNASSAQQVFLACGFSHVSVRESNMQIPGFLKEIIRKCLWIGLKFKLKMTLFATGRSTRNVLFSPNMILIACANEK